MAWPFSAGKPSASIPQAAWKPGPLRWDIALPVVSGIIAHARLKEELLRFFDSPLPAPLGQGYLVGNLYHAVFGLEAKTILHVLGVSSAIALTFIAVRVIITTAKTYFPELSKPQPTAPAPHRVNYRLPAWPEKLHEPQFVLGELHGPEGSFSAEPTWYTLPFPGLAASMIVFGAPGSAKTTSVIEPLVTQLLEHCPNQPRQKPALFLLDRKGTLSAKVSSLAARHGRSKDVVVLKLGGPRKRPSISSPTPCRRPRPP
jgi:hypothetical protein